MPAGQLNELFVQGTNTDSDAAHDETHVGAESPLHARPAAAAPASPSPSALTTEPPHAASAAQATSARMATLRQFVSSCSMLGRYHGNSSRAWIGGPTPVRGPQQYVNA
jgi:hypothetical protein